MRFIKRTYRAIISLNIVLCYPENSFLLVPVLVYSIGFDLLIECPINSILSLHTIQQSQQEKNIKHNPGSATVVASTPPSCIQIRKITPGFNSPYGKIPRNQFSFAVHS